MPLIRSVVPGAHGFVAATGQEAPDIPDGGHLPCLPLVMKVRIMMWCSQESGPVIGCSRSSDLRGIRIGGPPPEVAGYLILQCLELLADPDWYRYRIPQGPCRRRQPRQLDAAPLLRGGQRLRGAGPPPVAHDRDQQGLVAGWPGSSRSASTSPSGPRYTCLAPGGLVLPADSFITGRPS